MDRRWATLPRLLAPAACALALAAAAPGDPSPPDAGLPAIVFVSRRPVPGAPDVVPGLGPHGRTIVTAGRLLVRERDGAIRELVPGRFLDVADPAVSPDGKRIAFAAVTHQGGAWRIWLVDRDGTNLEPMPVEEWVPGRGSPGGGSRIVRAGRFDDFDPCWTDPHTLVFASTRWPMRAHYADLPASNLYSIGLGPGVNEAPAARRLTAESQGAEEPCFDSATGHVLFSRWWFNRWLPGAEGPTLDPAASIAPESVNVWHAMETSLRGHGTRLAAADLRTRRGAMGYQPTVMPDGAIVAVYSGNLGLSPSPGPLGLHRLPRAGGPAERVAGAWIPTGAGTYHEDRGLASPSACAPAALPDGRLLYSWSPGARGDFGIYVARPGEDSDPEALVDLPGTLELDAAPILARPAPPRLDPWPGPDAADGPAPSPPAATPYGWADRERLARAFVNLAPHGSAGLESKPATSRFMATDVFGGRPLDAALPGPPARIAGARLRFYAALEPAGEPRSRSLALLYEVPVERDGAVNVLVPADLPMFEQLVDSTGRVLMGTRGPAHVAGANAAPDPRGTTCIGCHAGHSFLDGTTRLPAAMGDRFSPPR